MRIQTLQKDDAIKLETAHLGLVRRLGHERAKFNPELGVQAVDIADGVINFARKSDNWSRAYGVGLTRDVTDDELDELEYQFLERGLTPQVTVTPFTSLELLQQLAKRGYFLNEWTNVLIRPLATGEQFPPVELPLEVHAVEPDEFDKWAETFSGGFATLDPDLASPDELKEFRDVEDCRFYLATDDGVTAGAAVLTILGEIAMLTGASTLPDYRRRGVQNALIHRRFNDAIAAGCKAATIITMPGSDSQRNAERRGFHIAYPQVNFRKML